MTDYTGGTPFGFMLDADHVVTTTTATNVPGLVFSANENSLYVVTFIGSAISSVNSSGVGLQLVVPTGARVIGLNYNLATAAQAMSAGEQIASGALTNNGSSGVRAAGAEFPLVGEWSVKMGATPGVIQLQARPEVTATTLTIKAGSILVAWGF